MNETSKTGLSNLKEIFIWDFFFKQLNNKLGMQFFFYSKITVFR